ncbi:MAG: tRNA (cytidine(56)-2'-O)-methyltransferase [Candidatus Diapherotrites archaeon]|nr:tRNA (cytidine(56)-2'-O)-methyltransferase [Candidatus Diapherotrites archaeon]
MAKQVVVLRYGHRTGRDDRVSTHCCLVARAFGAERIIIIGKKDEKIEDVVKKLCERWGGPFNINFSTSWREELQRLKAQGFKAVHLTMYGKPLQKVIEDIKKCDKIVVIIGSKKVEIGVYEESDYNVAITKQPHSEIAALAVFLDWYFGGKELEKKFKDAKIVLTEKDEKPRKK